MSFNDRIRHLHAVNANGSLRPAPPRLSEGLLYADSRAAYARRVLAALINIQTDSVAEFGADDAACGALLANSISKYMRDDPEPMFDVLALAIRRLATK